MSVKIYQILKEAIPELIQQNNLNSEDFYEFSEWINETHPLFHYIELKEYYDNGIEDNFYFKKFNVDVDALQSEIEVKINELFQSLDDDEELSGEEYYDIMEQMEEAIFNKIKETAHVYQLSLLVIHRENPYWLLVPTQNEVQLNKIVGCFNEEFNQDGDLNMAIYK